MGKGDVASPAAKRWVDKVVSFGCITCRNAGRGPTPGVYHHIRTGAGGQQKNGPFLGICLCPFDHDSYHHAPGTFERIHGTELDLLNQTIGEVAGRYVSETRIP